ncbi:MAG: aldo/keto reductase [Desulfobacterales bacterium]|jgi:aryl-alcohol dehydrogenase-like predicted oxidoreductase
MNDDFLYRVVSPFGRRVFRLGLATNYGIEGEDLEWALDKGVNYILWTPNARKISNALKAALKRDRESLILASGPTTGYFGGSIKRACERLLKTLKTDYLDVFQLFWLGRTSLWTSSTIDALVSLRESGKVRAFGVSIHDRKRAGKLAEDSPLDMLMVRYNAAHTGAEQDVFPHLTKRKPTIIAYTATRWRGLLKRPKNWSGPVMTASDCYRFCLSNPHVDIVLTGPKTRQQLQDNLIELREKGPLSEEENGWMRDYGQIVHQKSSRFTFRF